MGGQCRQSVDETQWVRHADCKMAASSVTIEKQRALIYNSALKKNLNVLIQSLVVLNFTVIVEVLSVQRAGFYTRDLWWRTREACVRFVKKNQRELCQVCGEEPERPVWGLRRRIREGCVRFVVKNQRGLCEICGEESERAVRDFLKTLAMRHVSVRICRFPVAYYHFSYSPYPFIHHPWDGQKPN